MSRETRGGGHLINDVMRHDGAERRLGAAVRRAFVSLTSVVALCLLSAPANAQVVHYPGSETSSSSSSVLAGIGGGAEAPVSAAPGNRIEIADAGIAAEATTLPPRFIDWERWWHGQLYGTLTARGHATASGSAMDLDSLINQDIVRLLRKRFENGSIAQRAAAAVALARLGSRAVSNDLIFALETAPPAVQESIVLAFGMSGSEEARSLLSSLALDGRFGRRSIGTPRQPVPEAIRCIAIVASGMLPAKKSDSTLHKLLSNPNEHSLELRRAACLALGLHATLSAEAGQTERRYGRTVRSWNLCVEHEAFYVGMLDDEQVSDDCKSILLLSLARALPASESLPTRIIKFLGGTNSTLSRSAAIAAGDLEPADRSELEAAMWRRLAKGGDAATSGLLLLSLGKRADAKTFESLLKFKTAKAATRPYQAFALLKAVEAKPERRPAAVAKVRELLQMARHDDGIGLAGTCVALGLLGDTGACEQLAAINREHSMVTARSAAALALGLLGRTSAGSAAWLQQADRADSFLVHDGALALALSDSDKAAGQLCSTLTERTDAYSLGGIAQALGLLRKSSSVPLLADIIEDDQKSDEARAFAIGALGLVLERNPGAWTRRLRSLSPIPPASSRLRNLLAHL